MKRQGITRVIESRSSREDVEAFARQRIQARFQRLDTVGLVLQLTTREKRAP